MGLNKKKKRNPEFLIRKKKYISAQGASQNKHTTHITEFLFPPRMNFYANTRTTHKHTPCKKKNSPVSLKKKQKAESGCTVSFFNLLVLPSREGALFAASTAMAFSAFFFDRFFFF